MRVLNLISKKFWKFIDETSAVDVLIIFLYVLAFIIPLEWVSAAVANQLFIETVGWSIFEHDGLITGFNLPKQVGIEIILVILIIIANYIKWLYPYNRYEISQLQEELHQQMNPKKRVEKVVYPNGSEQFYEL